MRRLPVGDREAGRYNLDRPSRREPGAVPVLAAKGDAMKEFARHIMVDFLPMKEFAETR